MPDQPPTPPATGAPATPATGAAPQTQTPTPPAAAPVGTPSEQGDPSQLGDAGKRALDAERQARRDAEARLKELEPLASKAKELEDAQKTEQQRLTEQLQTAQTEGATATSDLLRLQVALANAPAGMDPAKISSLAGRLRGATREELEADAVQLFADFSGAPSPVPPANGGQQTPVEQLRPGALPTTPEPTVPQQIAAAEKAGDWATARRLKSQQLMELQQKTN